MKRYIFYFFLLAGLGGSTAIALMMPEFLPEAINAKNGYEVIKSLVDSIIDGSIEPAWNVEQIFQYALVLFALMNAAIVLTMLLILIFTGFRIGNIEKFYRISIWFFISSIVITAAHAYAIIDADADFKFVWQVFLPIAASIVVGLLGIILRNVEKKND